MPELPDIELYLRSLRPRVIGHCVNRVRVVSPFVLRTFDPPVETLERHRIGSVSRLGKRFVFAFDGSELFLVVHLMIAGRWRWFEKANAKLPAKIGLAALDLDNGTLALVEASTQKRAGIYLVRGSQSLAQYNPGGLDVLTCSTSQFRDRLLSENHSLKRALTDPRLFDGIGNAYSDEILHAARLSPVQLTSRLKGEEIERLHRACRDVLDRWTAKLADEFADRFPGPGDVTAFRSDFAVHGKYHQPCPICGTSVQRIRYAENETNYCPRCQTDGTVLADRSLSRLLKGDWPRRVEDWE